MRPPSYIEVGLYCNPIDYMMWRHDTSCYIQWPWNHKLTNASGNDNINTTHTFKVEEIQISSDTTQFFKFIYIILYIYHINTWGKSLGSLWIISSGPKGKVSDTSKHQSAWGIFLDKTNTCSYVWSAVESWTYPIPWNTGWIWLVSQWVCRFNGLFWWIHKPYWTR